MQHDARHEKCHNFLPLITITIATLATSFRSQIQAANEKDHPNGNIKIHQMELFIKVKNIED